MIAHGDRFVYQVSQSRGQLTAFARENANRRRAEPDASYQVPRHETVEAMIRAGDQLWLAVQDRSEPDRATGRIHILDGANLKEVAVVPLPEVPDFQGLAAAQGRLYVSLRDGRVLSVGR